jgi:hypothetical protein
MCGFSEASCEKDAVYYVTPQGHGYLLVLPLVLIVFSKINNDANIAWGLPRLTNGRTVGIQGRNGVLQQLGESLIMDLPHLLRSDGGGVAAAAAAAAAHGRRKMSRILAFFLFIGCII